MFHRILVPTDGSDITQKAIGTAIGLAKAVGGRIYSLAVKEPFPYSAVSEIQPIPPQDFLMAQDQIAATHLKQVQQACSEVGLSCETHAVDALHPWEAVIEFAQNNACDLIVMASHGRRGVTALLLGSETQKVLTHTKVPVLVVR